MKCASARRDNFQLLMSPGEPLLPLAAYVNSSIFTVSGQASVLQRVAGIIPHRSLTSAGLRSDSSSASSYPLHPHPTTPKQPSLSSFPLFLKPRAGSQAVAGVSGGSKPAWIRFDSIHSTDAGFLAR